MSNNKLLVTDCRTIEKYELTIEQETISGIDLRQIKQAKEDFGLMSYDPGFSNTAYCRSKITYIDGDKGILRYRGYPIEQLADNRNFLEVSYLIFYGELPTVDEYKQWVDEISEHANLPSRISQLIASFPKNGHPMGMMMSVIAALSSYYHEAIGIENEPARQLEIRRLIAKVPIIASWVHRHVTGSSFVESNPKLSYAANFLNMVFSSQKGGIDVCHPAIEKAMDVLFVLHADHEQNCSTTAMRNVGSSKADPYSALAAAVGALSGPLHGGANEAVLRMLGEIGSKDRVSAHVERVKQGQVRLMGFGHRVYKNYDPRAKIIKKMAEQVFEVTGSSPLLDVALELEKIALEDDYFIARKLYPNVDFYSGLIYKALGFPSGMFPVLFAVARTSGWLAQWQESQNDPEQKIARPRQIYEGHPTRDVPAR